MKNQAKTNAKQLNLINSTDKKTAKKSAAAKTKKPDSKGKLGSLLGHSVISVVRAMGKHGWTFDDAKAALEKAKIKAAEHTISRALKRGQKGQKKIAAVSANDLAALRVTGKIAK